VVSPHVSITDSAGTTAAVVATELADRALERVANTAGTLRLLATDGANRFARVGGTFLGEQLAAGDIELVDL
jgi:glutamate racemase